MSEFESFTFYTAPDPFEPEPESPRPNYIRPIVTILMVIVLVVGLAVYALRPYFMPDDFSAVLTGVADSANTNCRDVQRVNVTRSLNPTRILCVCGRIITLDSQTNVDYHLRLKSGNGDTVAHDKFSNQPIGTFCEVFQLKTTIGGGHYLLEISNGSERPAIAWLHFTVIDRRPRA